jgi:methylated-DNA-[protein]-cysteine S-methyltransferase
MQTYSTYYHSPLGVLRILGTESYISEVHFMNKGEEMNAVDYLPATLINCTEQFIQYFNGERKNFDVPINQLGTTFQQEVWIELRTISYAKTISYLDLARRIGDSKATRAVANANGKNNIAVIVPCHRVIGSNKELIGYGGGLWRKKWLLEHETKVAYGVQTLF